MIERPVILLSFANQQDAYLAKLKEESSLLNDILSTHHDKGTVEVYREESTNIDNILKAINRFKDRIIVYHYAGHADGDRLYFEGGAGQAVGLAELLGQLPNLRLVFLNGCSTMAQVDKLLEAGVKAVIATAVPINDSKAVEFAEYFYRAFANKSDIDAAFAYAVAAMRVRYGGAFNATIVNKGAAPAYDNTKLMPWGLYLNDNPAEILDWSIPTNFTPKVSRPPEVKYEVNAFMVEVIDAMIEHDKELNALAYNADNELIDERQALSLVIEHFPWPIGVQIRLLVTKDSNFDSPSVERIKQLVSTYISTTQFIFYIAISQLWEEKRNKTIPIRPYLLDLLYNNQVNFNYFDYLKHFVEIIKLLKSSGSTLFVKEFDGFITEFEKKEDLFNSYLYLESLRAKINAGSTTTLDSETYQLCADGEYFLSGILINLAFLVNYDLITIRDIQVVSYRHLETRFDHYIARLNAKVTDLAVTRALKPRSFDRFANNASVILTQNIQDPSSYLNLSPFIIDKNAFGTGMTEDRATEQQLFMYAYREGEEYKYFATLHNIYRVQERATDQLLTSEGIQADDGESNKRVKRVKPRTDTEERKSPYEVLKQQFSIFEKDLLD